MKTSELIGVLQESLAKNGDLNVMANSTYREYEASEINCTVAARKQVGYERPPYTGEVYFLISSAKDDKELAIDYKPTKWSDLY